jgi:hypothetical protein
VVDSVYGTLAIDGSTITDYAADYVNDEVDITVGADFYLSELYAWWVYNLTTSQGISDFFGALVAVDEGNFENDNTIVSIKLDNTTGTEVYALDNRRFFRSDGTRPVRNPTSGGGGVDVEWRSPVLIASVAPADIWNYSTRELTGIGSSGIASEATVAALPSAVDIRVELGMAASDLDAQLAALPSAVDIRVELGMAASDLDAQLDTIPTAAENRQEMDSNSTQLAQIKALAGLIPAAL